MSEVAVNLTCTREETTKKKTHCIGKLTLDLLDKISLPSSRPNRIAHLHLNEDLHVVGFKVLGRRMGLFKQCHIFKTFNVTSQ